MLLAAELELELDCQHKKTVFGLKEVEWKA